MVACEAGRYQWLATCMLAIGGTEAHVPECGPTLAAPFQWPLIPRGEALHTAHPAMTTASETADNLWKTVEEGIERIGWHWFRYHFFHPDAHPMALSILWACGRIDAKAPGREGRPGIGTKLLQELAQIGGRDRHEPHYEMLLQKMAEILVIERIVGCVWPEGTTFEHEPAAFRDGPRPELLVVTPTGRLVVEVKAPALFNHIRQRGANGVQLPYRNGVPREVAQQVAGGDGLTLPRDYPVRDFLMDADRKFRGFRADGTTASLLVIVWDDYIYEPISSLVNKGSGLLTTNSFARADDGTALRFPDIDAVVALRHLHFFLMASRDEPLQERRHAMDFGDHHALPHVLFDGEGGRGIPEAVIEALRAYPHDDPGLLAMAEYHPQDIIFWT